MTTAEKYRQLENSPAINIARYIFSCVASNATNSTIGDEIIEIKTGKTPSKQNKKFYEDEFLNWFKPDEIGSERCLFEAKDKLSKYAHENNQATIFEPDTILINAIGDVGRISILKVKASSNQQITGIRFNNKIDVDYAYFYLLAHRHYFYIDLFQTTLPIVNQKKINSIPFVYPTIEEQRKIVEGLVEIEKIKSHDDLMVIDRLNWCNEYKNACYKFFSLQFSSKNISSELNHQLSLIKKLRQQLLQDAVQGKLVAQDPSDEPASELLKRIKAEKAKLIAEKKLKKEKDLPPIKPEEIPFEIPENWVWCRLGEASNLKRGKSKHRPRNDNSLFENGTHPFIQTGDVARSKKNNYIIDTINGYYNEFGLAQSLMQKKGTLCITIAANIAECGFLGFDACAPDSIVCLTASDVTIEKYCFYYIIQAREVIEKYAPATAQKNINLEILNSLIIPLPPLHEQTRIVQKLDELMQYCNDLEASIKENEMQNEQLLQQVLREALRKEPVEVK
jgi:type I restriction enzyme S subunit